MSLKHNNNYVTIEKAKENNRKSAEAKNKYGGCIDSYCCEGCGLILYDEICCCGGGICPVCKHSTSINGIGIMFNDLPKFTIKFLPPLPEPEYYI